MAPPLADAELIDRLTVHRALVRPPAGVDGDLIEPDGQLTAARGVIIGVLIATPLWALIGFTLYQVF